MLDKAIAIAATAFEGKFDKGDAPYILHCLHVMHKVKYLGTDAMVAAVLHDLLEDTDWTGAKLIKDGFAPHTVSIIELLTHKKDESYDEYIRHVSVSKIARAIKMADLRHNSDAHRLKGLRQKDHERITRYHKAYAFLKEVKD